MTRIRSMTFQSASSGFQNGFNGLISIQAIVGARHDHIGADRRRLPLVLPQSPGEPCLIRTEIRWFPVPPQIGGDVNAPDLSLTAIGDSGHLGSFSIDMILVVRAG